MSVPAESFSVWEYKNGPFELPKRFDPKQTESVYLEKADHKKIMGWIRNVDT